MEISQLNVFDVLLDALNEQSKTLKARKKIITEFPIEAPPNDSLVPTIKELLANDVAIPETKSQINFNVTGKHATWWQRNWPWVLLCVVISVAIGIWIHYYIENKKETIIQNKTTKNNNHEKNSSK